MEDEMEPGYIYVHRNLATGEQQVWVYRDERGWVVADMHKDYKHTSMRHPTYVRRHGSQAGFLLMAIRDWPVGTVDVSRGCASHKISTIMKISAILVRIRVLLLRAFHPNEFSTMFAVTHAW